MLKQDRKRIEKQYTELMRAAALCRSALEALDLLENLPRKKSGGRVAKNSAKVARKRVAAPGKGQRRGGVVMSNGRTLTEAGRRAISKAQKARHAANRKRKGNA